MSSISNQPRFKLAMTLRSAVCCGFLFLNSSYSNGTVQLPYLPKISSEIGAELVKVDLLKLHKREINEIKSTLSRVLTGEVRNVEISKYVEFKNNVQFDQLMAFASKNVSAPHLNSPGLKIKGLKQSQAEELLKELVSHPVVGNLASPKYDTWDQMIGYCFGRAAFVHWNLLRHGVDSRGIGKLFAVGGLRHQDSDFRWDYHMATTVLSTDGDWWVIDALVGKALKIKEWAKEVQKWSSDPQHPQIRFYFADPNKMFPIPGKYNIKDLLIPEYHGYFLDLIQWFKLNPYSSRDKSKFEYF